MSPEPFTQAPEQETETFESSPATGTIETPAEESIDWKRYGWAGAVLLLVLFAAGSIPFLWGSGLATEEEPYKIGVLRYIRQLSASEDGFYEGMRELGYVEGKNVEYIVTPYGENPAQMSEIAQDLIEQDVDMIFAITNVAATGARQATEAMGRTDIPVIFTHANTPDRTGLIESFQSPGGNLTGVAVNFVEITEKKLEFLRQIDPTITRVGILDAEFTDPAGAFVQSELVKAAPKFDMEIVMYPVMNDLGPEATAEIEAIAQNIQQGDIDGFFYLPGTVSNPPPHVQLIADMAKRVKIPSVYLVDSQVVGQGGLFTYAHDLVAMGKQTASIAHKVLQGQGPAEIPVEFPRNNVLTINMTTAQELGITIPESMLLIANTVGE